MPNVRRTVDLSTTSPTEVIAPGNVALSLVITSATVGVVFEIRLGTNGDWLGPFLGAGDFPMTITIGDGLPDSDRNRGVFVRAPIAAPGAAVVVNASFGDKAGAGAGTAVAS